MATGNGAGSISSGFAGALLFSGDVLGRRYRSIQDQSAATLLTGRDPSNRFLLSLKVM